MSIARKHQIFGNVLRVAVSDKGYEWVEDIRPPHKLVLSPCLSNTGQNVFRQALGVSAARRMLAGLRTVAKQAQWLRAEAGWMLTPVSSPYARDQTESLRLLPESKLIEQAMQEIVRFADAHGSITSERQSFDGWCRDLDRFLAIDRLCQAIRTGRYSEIQANMAEVGSAWYYTDIGIHIVIAQRGSMAELEGGHTRDWFTIASGSVRKRAGMALSKALNEELRNGLGVSVDTLRPSEGVLTPASNLSTAYFLLWQSIADPEPEPAERFCIRCGRPIPQGKRKGVRYCGQAACYSAEWRDRHPAD